MKTLLSFMESVFLINFMVIQGAAIATVVSSYVIYHFRKRADKNDFHVTEYWNVLATWSLFCIEAVLEIYTHAWYLEMLILLALLGMNGKLMRETVTRIRQAIIKAKENER